MINEIFTQTSDIEVNNGAVSNELFTAGVCRSIIDNFDGLITRKQYKNNDGFKVIIRSHVGGRIRSYTSAKTSHLHPFFSKANLFALDNSEFNSVWCAFDNKFKESEMSLLNLQNLGFLWAEELKSKYPEIPTHINEMATKIKTWYDNPFKIEGLIESKFISLYNSLTVLFFNNVDVTFDSLIKYIKENIEVDLDWDKFEFLFKKLGLKCLNNYPTIDGVFQIVAADRVFIKLLLQHVYLYSNNMTSGYNIVKPSFNLEYSSPSEIKIDSSKIVQTINELPDFYNCDFETLCNLNFQL